jgi:hypothetical protein
MDLMTDEISGAAPELETEKTEKKERDLRPEFCQYRDEGCEYAKACLDCPFPQCLYDEPRGHQRWLKEIRDKEIKRLYEAGRNFRELATIFDVSDRTVHRAVNSISNRRPVKK